MITAFRFTPTGKTETDQKCREYRALPPLGVRGRAVWDAANTGHGPQGRGTNSFSINTNICIFTPGEAYVR